ncbi:glycosyltransferase 87 family protein [Streptomyces sp. NPDC001595]|uniref:glycosyltransferase family 87 protein n=1 Tax=Streptomyces sp. NPDC001532 TaxID=3154520 RepID=UPI00331E01AF
MTSQTRRLLALTAAWPVTRALMLWLLAHNAAELLGNGSVAREVWRLYRNWSDHLAREGFPTDDALWQYPPGAGPVLLAPELLPGLTYFQAFVVLSLAADAVITVALARAGSRPGRTLLGPALWILALPLLLHVPLARYDLQVTAFAVVALVALTRSTRACGAFAALGALVKVWPALVLVGVPKGRATRRAWGSAAVTGAVALGLLAVAFAHPLAFLRQQGGRGVQIESFGGTLLGLATHAGWPGTTGYRYGALEFSGPYVSAVATASLALTAVAFALLLRWRLTARHWSEATPYDAALTAVLLFTVTSRVLSPQYMIWLLGLAAVCLTSRQTSQRPVAALIVAATAVTGLIYPVLYDEVAASTATGCALLVVRNGLLGTAAVLSFVRLRRVTTRSQSEPAPASLGAGHTHRAPTGAAD